MGVDYNSREEVDNHKKELSELKQKYDEKIRVCWFIKESSFIQNNRVPSGSISINTFPICPILLLSIISPS